MPTRLRNALSAALIALSCLLVPFGALAACVTYGLADTGRYVTAMAPLAADPAVQGAVADSVEAGILDEVDDRHDAGTLGTPVVAGFGSEEAVHAAYLLHGAEIYRFLLRGLDDPGAAQDVTQETFLKVYKNAKEFRGQSALSTWIYRIAVNQCLGSLRKKPKAPVASLDDENCKELPDTA